MCTLHGATLRFRVATYWSGLGVAWPVDAELLVHRTAGMARGAVVCGRWCVVTSQVTGEWRPAIIFTRYSTATMWPFIRNVYDQWQFILIDYNRLSAIIDDNNNNNNLSTLHSMASFISCCFISGSPMEVMLYGCALLWMLNAQLLHTKV